MKTKTSDLIKMFKKLKVGISRKEIIQQATHITFDGSHAFTFDGHIYVFYPFPTDFKCCVPANELIKIVSGIKEDEIELTYLKEEDKEKGDGSFNIKGKKIKAKLKTMEMSKEYVLKTDYKLQKLPSDFNEAISMCSFSTSQNVSEWRNGICVRGDKVCGSDDYRISEYSMKAKVKTDFLIPLASVLSLKDFDVIKYYVEESWVFFQDSDKAFFCSRLLREEDYRDWSKYFKSDGTRITFPSNVKPLIEKALILAPGDFDIQKKITVTIEDKKLTCTSENDIGWIETFINIKSKKKIKFTINPLFFLQILNKTNFGIVGEDQIVFETDNFRHLVALHEEE